jgi:hypothetical protein
MARNISAAALAKLATQYGVESVIILAVHWVQDEPPIYYADRDVGWIKGRILEVSNLDNVVNVSSNNSSQEISIVLDDTDGTIKAIFDQYDIHQRDVVVYQWFDGLGLDDKFVLFQGKISSPISWSEGERTLSFSVLSQIEDTEFGFSPEEGEFTHIPASLIGKPWPSVFGRYVHVPGVKITEAAVGTLGDGFGVHDFTLSAAAGANNVIRNYALSVAQFWFTSAAYLKGIGADDAAEQAVDTGNQLLAQATSYEQKAAECSQVLAEQKATEKSTLRILGGNRFPQGVHLSLDINGIVVSGSFAGETFHVSSYQHPDGSLWPQNPSNPGGSSLIAAQKQFPYAVGFGVTQADHSSFTVYTGEVAGDTAGYASAQAGARVTIHSAEPLSFVASITPGSVLSVSAWVELEGVRHLVDVPGNLWSASVQSFGPINATIVTLHDALSKRTGEGWRDDELYITFESTIGPNTSEVLEYIIETYTDFAVDATTFDDVAEKIENYPSHFAVLDRPQVLSLLQDIAFQARCSLFLKEGTFYVTYLPEEPASVATITESDVDVSSLVLSLTSTEELVTKLVAKWRASGAQPEDNTIILRHNVAKYGTKEREVNVFIYNNPDLVLKSMTYWLIRWANTWKHLKFTTAINLLNVETLDAVTLGFSRPYVASEDVLARVEDASYNSATNTLEFNCWVPVKAGEMMAYEFAYPKDVSAELRFPTPREEAAGFSGGVGPGKEATGALQESRSGLSVTYNGTSDPFGFGDRVYGDEGGSKPSDVGDQNPGAANASGSGATNATVISATASPNVNAGALKPEKQVFYIDLHKTNIVDTQTGSSAPLATFFKDITEKKLRMNTDASITDGEQDGSFDFEFDSEGTKWGAGTAFLKD